MRLSVDRSLCDLHGQCVFAAPEVFSFAENGELQYLPEVPDELADKARAAALVCPAAAVEVQA